MGAFDYLDWLSLEVWGQEILLAINTISTAAPRNFIVTIFPLPYTFACWNEKSRSSSRPCVQEKLQHFEPSNKHVISVALLQTLPKTGLEPGLPRDCVL